MIQALIPLLGTVFDKILPDPQAAAEAKLKVLELSQRNELAELDADLKLALAQIDVNKTEAGSASLFKSGWRPAVGWVCVFGLSYSFIVQPMLAWISGIVAIPVPPTLDLSTLLTMLSGLLGLGGFRTAEKMKGVAAR